MDPLDLLMCHTCGTQFNVPASQPLSGCDICDDPRQYVPPTGQRWTSLRAERALAGAEAHLNHIIPLTITINSNSTLATPDSTTPSTSPIVENAYTLETTPKLGIGQRAHLLITPHGTIMWDLLAFLDAPTIAALSAPPFNGLRAIVISHPHYYTNHLDWADAFNCPVYLAAEDAGWVRLGRTDEHGRRRWITTPTEEIVPGVTAIKVGGHFPGSLVLHWEKKLFIADSLVTQPSALYHVKRPQGTTSFAFMWSIPNMIPLPPEEMLQMWRALETFEFEQTHGAFTNQDVFDPNVKGRILESMKIQAKASTGVDAHVLADLKWP